MCHYTNKLGMFARFVYGPLVAKTRSLLVSRIRPADTVSRLNALRQSAPSFILNRTQERNSHNGVAASMKSYDVALIRIRNLCREASQASDALNLHEAIDRRLSSRVR